MKAVPHKASKKIVLRVGRFLDLLGLNGLRQFRNVGKLEEWGLRTGYLTREFPESMPKIPSDYVVDSLAVCTDQEQLQITVGDFIHKPEPVGLECTGVDSQLISTDGATI